MLPGSATRFGRLKFANLLVTKFSATPAAQTHQKGRRLCAMASARGAFIVFEGIDRCGKTTQCSMLVERLKAQNIPAELWRFPDRACKATGSIINSYLAKDIDLSDESIHLLFSANRWEKRAELERKLSAGVTLVLDRYAYSGIAYSVAKDKPNMSIEWCRACDAGLPAPDRVLYMQMSPEASAKRGGFGEERYEKRAFQEKVSSAFVQLKDSHWVDINADQPVESVHAQVMAEVSEVMAAVSVPDCPVFKLWGQEIRIPAPSAEPTSSRLPDAANSQDQQQALGSKGTAAAKLHVVAQDSNASSDQQL